MFFLFNVNSIYFLSMRMTQIKRQFAYLKVKLSFVYPSYILRVSFVEDKEKVWLSYEEGCLKVRDCDVILILKFRRDLCASSVPPATKWLIWQITEQQMQLINKTILNCQSDIHSPRANAELLAMRKE